MQENGKEEAKYYLRKCAGILLLRVYKGCKPTKSEERKHSKRLVPLCDFTYQKSEEMRNYNTMVTHFKGVP